MTRRKKKSTKISKIKHRGRKHLVRELDTVFSMYVRSRDRWKCLLRGHGYNCGGPMQCNHLVSRGKQSIRWDEKNAISGCAGHNTWASHNPVEWRELWVKLFPERTDYLLSKAKEISRPSDWTLQVWINEFRQKFVGLEGVTVEEYKARAKELR